MKKTILVTGGAGYIGSHVIIELLRTDKYNVISVDCFLNSSPKTYERIKEIAGKQFGTYNVNLCNEEKLEKVFIENKIDAVIHFAALKSVGESVENPLWYYDNNINSLINLLKFCKEFEVTNFIFSSSCSVYGNIEKLPVDENTPLGKTESPYAYTKQVGEQIIQDFCSINNMNAISMRYFNPVGADISGKIGESPINKPNNLIPLIMGVGIGKYPQLTVFGNDYPTRDGTCIRDYVHVSDIARAHILAIEYKTTGKYKVFNLGSGNGVTVLEAISAFEKVADKKVNYVIGQARKGDIIAVYSDSTKVFKELGWKCEHDIVSMMKTAWAWEIYYKYI